MSIGLLRNKLIWSLSASVFLFSMMIPDASAEYYMVTDGGPDVIWLTGCKAHRHHRVHKYKTYRVARPYSRASISVYYIWQVGCCGQVYVPRCGYHCADRSVRYYRDEGYQVYYAQPDSGYRYRDWYYAYDPDLTTGDDDPIVDPDMDIDH